MAIETNILLETGTNELEIVEFVLHYKDKTGKDTSQYFGINVAKVREIIRMPKLTKIPNMPKTVYGVFNLRGSIIPGLDLCKFLYGVENSSPDNKMIIAEFNKRRFGFIVNDVYRIHRISWQQIISPDTIQEFEPEKTTIVGFINFDNRHILMLDVEKIVSDIDPLSALDSSQPKETYKRQPIAITAEDSAVIRKMITDRLKTAGFDIISFGNGQDAWLKLEEISRRVSNGEDIKKLVNIVITDIEMPKLDGYTLTKKIKQDPNLSQIPVVIFSSIVSTDIIHKGKAVGADAQLTKPQVGELLDTIRYLLHTKMGIS